jgi:hypothetical protein
MMTALTSCGGGKKPAGYEDAKSECQTYESLSPASGGRESVGEILFLQHADAASSANPGQYGTLAAAAHSLVETLNSNPGASALAMTVMSEACKAVK